jgi:hypothetical protein
MHSHLYAGAEGERKGEDDKEEGEEGESQGAESWTLRISCNQEKYMRTREQRPGPLGWDQLQSDTFRVRAKEQSPGPSGSAAIRKK